MKQYILDALSDGHKVVLSFDKDHKKTFSKLLNSFPNSAELIELSQANRENFGAFLVNLNHVRYVKVQKAIR